MKAAILGRLFVLGSAAKRDVAILQRYARKALGMGRRPVGSRLNVINPFAFHSRLCGDESCRFPLLQLSALADGRFGRHALLGPVQAALAGVVQI
jgi:hypothetical protein